MNDQLIEERLGQLTPEYRSYLESDHLTLICTTFASTFTEDEKRIDVLENGFYFHLLFFFTKDQLIAWCVRECGVTGDTAPGLVEAMILALPPEIRTLYEATWQQLHEASGASAEIAEAEAMLAKFENAAQPVATEAAVAPEPIYTSTQSALLRGTATNQTVPPPPRWDSAQ